MAQIVLECPRLDRVDVIYESDDLLTVRQGFWAYLRRMRDMPGVSSVGGDVWLDQCGELIEGASVQITCADGDQFEVKVWVRDA